MPPTRLPALIIIMMAWLGGPTRGEEARDRQPAALALSLDGSRLFVANGRSGSLSVVDLAAGKVTAEVEVGRGLADLASLPDGRLVAVDRPGNALVLLDATPAIARRLALADDPTSVLVAPDGRSCVVASTRSSRLTVATLADPPTVARTIDLPFPPRLMAWLRPGATLVVADAYGGRLATVDPSTGVVGPVRSLPGHNIRGLAVSPDGRSLLVAHQTLNPLARSSFEDVHWGALMKNHLRSIRVAALLAPGSDSDLLLGGPLVEVGETGHAAGDLGAIGFAKGRVVVAVGGVGEVAIGPTHGWPLRRVAVGGRPSAVIASIDGKIVYVADTASDSVAIVDAEAVREVGSISLGPRPEPDAVSRGERLFFDARLSHDGWMSCHSCHTDGHTNGLLADTLGDGSFGAPKRVTSLLGAGRTAPWTWLGTVDRLEDQVRKSVETSMRGHPPTDAQVADLSAFLRSLPPPSPSIEPGRDEAIDRGRALFEVRKCGSCHAPPEYTTTGRYDVGLLDEAGNRSFNPPSLRGVGRRSPLLHDGRADTLADVFLKHRHPRDAVWTPGEVGDLVAFLKTL